MKREHFISHDAAAGPLTRCQITGSENLNLVIDLGHQPPCDALLSSADEVEAAYPLRLMHCPESGLAQLDFVVDGATIYPKSYPYRAGISWPVVEAHRVMARELVERFGAGFHVDIGSNDGTLIGEFSALGCECLGVEPTDVAKLSKIETVQAFFTEALARDIVKDRGQARFITMTNVFAHMAGLGEVMRGIDALLDRHGVFVTESHYLLDILDKTQFDTIYHEHIRTYSLKSLVTLFPMYGMEVFDVERHERYGGNIRAYVCRSGARPVEKSVGELLALEDARGLHKPETWIAFRDNVYRQREQFMDFLRAAKANGQSVAGCSAPGRASTLLNFYGVTPDLLPYLGELHNSLKLGKFVPGCRIPIVSNQRIVDDPPRWLVLLAWHYAGPIVKRLRLQGVTSNLMVPLPQFGPAGDAPC